MRQYRDTKTRIVERDEWRTPMWLYRWLSDKFAFDIDLAATPQNALCSTFFTKEYDSLKQTWREYGSYGFCNPPYSNIAPFYEKAIKEVGRGFTSVFVVPTLNADARDLLVLKHASELVYIVGRVNFLRPDGSLCTGNMRGTCIVVFSPFRESVPALSWHLRDTLMDTYGSKP